MDVDYSNINDFIFSYALAVLNNLSNYKKRKPEYKVDDSILSHSNSSRNTDMYGFCNNSKAYNIKKTADRLFFLYEINYTWS